MSVQFLAERVVLLCADCSMGGHRWTQGKAPQVPHLVQGIGPPGFRPFPAWRWGFTTLVPPPRTLSASSHSSWNPGFLFQGVPAGQHLVILSPPSTSLPYLSAPRIWRGPRGGRRLACQHCPECVHPQLGCDSTWARPWSCSKIRAGANSREKPGSSSRHPWAHSGQGCLRGLPRVQRYVDPQPWQGGHSYTQGVFAPPTQKELGSRSSLAPTGFAALATPPCCLGQGLQVLPGSRPSSRAGKTLLQVLPMAECSGVAQGSPSLGSWPYLERDSSSGLWAPSLAVRSVRLCSHCDVGWTLGMWPWATPTQGLLHRCRNLVLLLGWARWLVCWPNPWSRCSSHFLAWAPEAWPQLCALGQLPCSCAGAVLPGVQLCLEAPLCPPLCAWLCCSPAGGWHGPTPSQWPPEWWAPGGFQGRARGTVHSSPCPLCNGSGWEWWCGARVWSSRESGPGARSCLVVREWGWHSQLFQGYGGTGDARHGGPTAATAAPITMAAPDGLPLPPVVNEK